MKKEAGSSNMPSLRAKGKGGYLANGAEGGPGPPRKWRPHEKIPQVDPGNQTMRDYKRHVAVFRLRTQIAAEKQGPELCAEFKGAAWNQAEELDPDSLYAADGVEQLLDFLCKKFDDTKV